MENAKFIYQHNQKCPYQPVDTHHIVVRGSGRRVLVIFFTALIFAGLLSAVIARERSSVLLLWSFPLGIFLVKALQLKPVKKESVLVMPGFGVQLETHYGSGRTNHCFVPINKILKPVLQECVTPVTCYWCLSLVVRDEDELMLVFKETHPPLKMLVPIWKALCNAVNEKPFSSSSATYTYMEDHHYSIHHQERVRIYTYYKSTNQRVSSFKSCPEEQNRPFIKPRD